MGWNQVHSAHSKMCIKFVTPRELIGKFPLFFAQFEVSKRLNKENMDFCLFLPTLLNLYLFPKCSIAHTFLYYTQLLYDPRNMAL